MSTNRFRRPLVLSVAAIGALGLAGLTAPAAQARRMHHPATLFVRRDLLVALGGWMALPASEDTGLLLALNAVSRGWFSQEVGLLYRKWEGQATGQAAHVDPAEREARMAVVEARARALAGLQWRSPAATTAL